MIRIAPKGSGRTLQVNFRVTPDLDDWLERYAESVGTSKADLVFQLIKNVKETQEHPDGNR